MSTETKPKIHLALIAIIQGIKAIAKDRKNDAQGFKFRGIDDVYDNLNPLFAEVGIVNVPVAMKPTYGNFINGKGNRVNTCTVEVTYEFVADDGSSKQAVSIGEAFDMADKATAKALSMAHKYLLFQTFLIPVKNIGDGDSDYISDAAEKLREEYGAEYKGRTLAELEKLRDEFMTANQEVPKTLLGAISEARNSDEPPPEKVKKAKVEKPAKTEPETPEGGQPTQAPEKPAGEAPANATTFPEPFLNYVITKDHMQNQAYVGKRIGDLSPSQLEMCVGWIVKQWDNINRSPLKTTLRENLMEAFAHFGVESGSQPNIMKALQEAKVAAK